MRLTNGKRKVVVEDEETTQITIKKLNAALAKKHGKGQSGTFVFLMSAITQKRPHQFINNFDGLNTI